MGEDGSEIDEAALNENYAGYVGWYDEKINSLYINDILV